MYRNMVTSLLEHERIETTDAKAKEVRRIAEKNKDVADDPGPELVKVMQQQRTSWNAFDHWALLAGIGLLALSFVLDLAFQIR